MTRFALSAPMVALLSTGALASPAASPATAEPMKGWCGLRGQAPQTRQ